MHSLPVRPRPSQPSALRRRSIVVAFALAWLAVVAVPPLLLLRVRAGWLEQLNRPEEQARWDEFRAAMREQSSGVGPVKRKVPKSAEPPLRVWLRDYVGLAVAAWVVLAGALGLFTGALALGAGLRGRARGPRLLPENETRRESDHQEEQERDAQNAGE